MPSARACECESVWVCVGGWGGHCMAVCVCYRVGTGRIRLGPPFNCSMRAPAALAFPHEIPAMHGDAVLTARESKTPKS